MMNTPNTPPSREAVIGQIPDNEEPFYGADEEPFYGTDGNKADPISEE